MKVQIEGNPGTGNTFMEINIQHVEHFHATVPNNNNGTRATQQDEDSQTIIP